MNMDTSVISKLNIDSARMNSSAIMKAVYEALKEKGYDPALQLSGYILTGDPTYITSHKGARSLIVKIERYELAKEMAELYLKTLEKE